MRDEQLFANAVARDWNEIIQRLGPLEAVLGELRLRVGTADACRALNLSSYADLNRELDARQLPPFRLLKNWYQVWCMIHLAETGTGSLCAVALRGGGYPAAHYRLAKSTTGHSWRVIRERGSEWVMACAIRAWEPYTRLQDRA